LARTNRGDALTIRLYGSWFSPFARKVALALELKSLPYDYVDGLVAENRAEIYKLDPRAEVPVLLDDGVVVINSSDIVQYLEWLLARDFHDWLFGEIAAGRAMFSN
jgi:glutathione S-transferase